MAPVLLPDRVRDEIIAHALALAPAECCGILIGLDRSIREAIPVPNISDDPHRYELDPRSHIEARRGARASGLEVVGFYHSHPHSPAEPSATDLAEASYPDALYLIVSLAVEPPVLRSFRFDGQRLAAVDVEVVA